MDKPNILFLMTDQHRFDCLSCMGNSILKTPNIDQLADEGICFTKAYTPSPVCGPARAAIFSGKYPPSCGVVENWLGFSDDNILIAEHLKNSGYATSSIGKLHFVPHQNNWGFDHKRLHDVPCNNYADDAKHSDYIKWLTSTYCKGKDLDPVRLFGEDEEQWPNGDLYRFIMGGNFIPEEYHATTWVAEESINLLESHKEDLPFFMFTSFFGPHHPWDPPSPWDKLYDPDDVELPSQFNNDMNENPIFNAKCKSKAEKIRSNFSPSDFKKIIAAYYGNIAMIDHYIGNIFQTLKQKGLWDNTMIIFAADHGEHCGQYGMFFKSDMYESAAHVPLLVKPANSQSQGMRCDKVVSTLDLYGTILDTAGNTNWRDSKDIESNSLLGVLSTPPEEQFPQADEAFSIIGQVNHELTMLRRGDMKLIRLAQGKGKPAIYELYDLHEQPFDNINVYGQSEYRTEQESLQESLDEWSVFQNSRYPLSTKSYRCN